jgi:predicted ATP-grasp superfamily ATP-dependent carboligase
MLYADQVGLPVVASRSRPGVGWLRMTTDLPAALLEMLAGTLDLRGYLRSLRESSVEAVFSREDPLPGLAEIFLIPYLAIKRGF